MSAAAPIRIRYAHWGSNPWIDSIVKGFNQSQTKYQVIYEQPGDYAAKMLTSMAAGSAPTVFSTGWWCGLGDWMNRGLLLDMGPLIRRETNFNIEDVPKLLREGGQLDGKTYAFPFEDIGANCVWYNNTMMRNAGLAKPSDNWTSQDFMEYAAKLTRDKNGDGKIDEYALDNITGWYETRVTAMAIAGGGLYYTNDRKSWIGDSPANVKALQQVADLITKYKYTSPGGLGLQSGKQGMAVRDACFDYYVSLAKGKWDFDVAPPPAIDGSGKRYAQDYQGTYLSIARNANSKQVDGAWEFIKYWTGEAGMKTAWEKNGWLQRPPARRSLAQYFTKPADKTFASITLTNFLKWETAHVTAENWPLENFSRIDETLQAGWNSVASGKLSVQQFVGNVSPKVKLLLKGRGK